jgi:uncharacterized protein YecE (DUF72 family)
MSIQVGISGWTYDGWRGTFYPAELPHKDELFFASREVPSIEINGTFYSLQRPSSYRQWYEKTPTDFIFSIKANRYITHIKRLKDVEVPIANFLASGLLTLEEKLGPILWQFPPSMRFDPEKFEHFFRLLPQDTFGAARYGKRSELPADRISLHVDINRPLRHAVEIRHESFLNPWFIDLLRKYNIALVFADTAGRWPYMEDITADFLYLRLHGDSELYVSGYDDETLDFWAQRLLMWSHGQEPRDRVTLTEKPADKNARDIFLYFDNDAKVRAPVDAKTLLKKLGPAAPLLQSDHGSPQKLSFR